MVASRADINEPGYYLDRSATGTGKSYADIQMCGDSLKSQVVTPTHENAEEIELEMQAAGLDARKYPGRHTSGEEINCTNETADTAENFGLSPMAAVCPFCKDAAKCVESGYRGQLAAVKMARVAIATHQRGVYNGINKLAAGRSYISIHEDSASVLCPDETVSLDDLQSMATVVNLILTDPKYLDWLGQSASKDDEGNWTPDEKLAERRNLIDGFVRHLADVIDALIADSETVEKTREAQIPKAIDKATGIENLLLRATIETKEKFTGAAWRVLLAAASGELYSIGWILDATPKGNAKVLIANWRNIPSKDIVTLFQDATVDREDLEMYIGHPVHEITPQGHVARSKRIVQFPKDVTRRTKANVFNSMIRGVMARFPDAKRIGIITHRPTESHLKKIGEPYASRIVKSTYFGSGKDRASNDWHNGECDLIIVAGTPRVSSITIQRRMIQFGDYGAAGETPDWGDVLWRGQTESGQEVIVTNRGHRQPTWKRAHRSLVRAEIVQAVGRGRSLLESGCDVAILSTEECGFPLADQIDSQSISLTQSDIDMLTTLQYLSDTKLTSRNLSDTYAYSIFKTTCPLTGRMSIICPLADIAHSSGLSDRQARRILCNLEQRGLASRHGQRGGWMLTDAGGRHCPTLAPAAAVASDLSGTLDSLGSSTL